MEMQEELEEQRERAAKQISDEIERKMDFVRRFKAKATKARQARMPGMSSRPSRGPS